MMHGQQNITFTEEILGCISTLAHPKAKFKHGFCKHNDIKGFL
jgi:hypothetical protein